LRYIRPVSFSCSVVAISTEKTCTPFLVTISSGWTLAARAAAPANAQSATATARTIQPPARMRRGSTPRSKFIRQRSSQPEGIYRAGPYPDDRGKYQTVGGAGFDASVTVA
jgi:hypothetical protein